MLLLFPYRHPLQLLTSSRAVDVIVSHDPAAAELRTTMSRGRVFLRQASYPVQLCIRIYCFTLFIHLRFNMQRFKHQQFDQRILAGVNIR